MRASPGAVFTIGNQQYRCVRITPYVKTNGWPSVISTWQSRCPDCNKVFRVKAGSVISKANRRCSRCAQPGVPVDGKRVRKRKPKRKAATIEKLWVPIVLYSERPPSNVIQFPKR